MIKIDKQIKEAEAALDTEMYRQIKIYYSAASLALHREWGWGRERIATMYAETQAAWNECAATNEVSMVQMLDEETGIELRNEQNQSWRTKSFLNSRHPANNRALTKPYILQMRREQKKWVGTLVFACILLGMHRRYGFGPDRLSRLVAYTIEIREEYDFDEERLLTDCKAETGTNITERIPDREKESEADGK